MTETTYAYIIQNKQRIPFSVGTKQKRGRIIPVFLPFAGCPFTCLYCVQDKQTGCGQSSITEALEKLDFDLQGFEPKAQNEAIEIAFYGGTFTALSQEDLRLCLSHFQKNKNLLEERGFQVYGRASTRPDCLQRNRLDTENLERIQEVGIDLLELGIQSFDDDCLKGLGRAYDGELAQEACAYVQEQGFLLGIQLMPSSPISSPISPPVSCPTSQSLFENKGAQTPSSFIHDVKRALSFMPSCLRYYPCLVPENTGLAALWKEGFFTPWDLETCVDSLGLALALAWEKEIPVIRLSVAPENDFDRNILAGVRHPALGSLIQGRALLHAFDRVMSLHTDKDFSLVLEVPKTVQGFIYGDKKNLKKEWEKRLQGGRIVFV